MLRVTCHVSSVSTKVFNRIGSKIHFMYCIIRNLHTKWLRNSSSQIKKTLREGSKSTKSPICTTGLGINNFSMRDIYFMVFELAPTNPNCKCTRIGFEMAVRTKLLERLKQTQNRRIKKRSMLTHERKWQCFLLFKFVGKTDEMSFTVGYFAALHLKTNKIRNMDRDEVTEKNPVKMAILNGIFVLFVSLLHFISMTGPLSSRQHTFTKK